MNLNFYKNYLELTDDWRLLWKKREQGPHSTVHAIASFNKNWAGKEAGVISSNGYRLINIQEDETTYRTSAHRIIYLMVHGVLPKHLDHIDGNRLNNNPNNLRDAVTHQENARNQKKNSNNTSGFTGVTWDKSKRKWTAQITLNRKNKFLGRFDEKADAIQARKTANIKYGFHANHGER